MEGGEYLGIVLGVEYIVLNGLHMELRVHLQNVGLGLKPSKAQNTLFSNTKVSIGPWMSSLIVVQTGECSKSCLGSCPSSPKVCEAEKTSLLSVPKPDIAGTIPTEHEVGNQKKLVKWGQEGHQELKNLMSSLNVEYGSVKLRSTNHERAVMVHQLI